MSFVLDIDENSPPITLIDMIERISDFYPLTNTENLLKAAPLLQRLARNPDFLRNWIFSTLANTERRQRHAQYAPTAHVIYRNDHFILRSVYWDVTSNKNLGALSLLNPIYAYGYPHDHNFHLLTVGLAGPGYRTKIYQYEYDDTEGYVGEDVSINFERDLYLTEGCALLMEQSRDIHVQFPPASPSISLNILVDHPEAEARRQYVFDLEKSKIVGYPSVPATKMLHFIDWIQMLPNGKYDKLVRNILSSNASKTIRMTILSGALSRYSNQQSSQIAERIGIGIEDIKLVQKNCFISQEKVFM